MKSQLLIRFRIILNESIMILKQQHEHAYSSEKMYSTIQQKEGKDSRMLPSLELHLFTTTQNSVFCAKIFLISTSNFSMAFKLRN